MFSSITSFALRAAPRLSIVSASNIGAIRCFSDVINSGTVKWFDTKKGFGFIVPDDGSEDIFVHQTSIHAEGFRSLADGEAVEFSTIKDANGKVKAENVTGPMGAYVQGAPRSPRMYSDNGFGGGRGGGGGFGGGYGNSKDGRSDM